MSLFTISFKAPTMKMNFQVVILKAVVFLRSPGDFKVGDMTCYKSQIKIRITSFQDIKEILEGLLYKQSAPLILKTPAINSLDEQNMKQSSYV